MSEPRTILITGSTDGLGRALAVRLADEGHNLILHGRSEEKLGILADELQRADGGRPATVRGDFSKLADVASVAERVAKLTDHLDVLVNNAGIGGGEPDGNDRRITEDGNELRFSINYLASFDLTLRLLPLLRRADHPRVVLVASLGQSPLDFDDLTLEHGYDGWRAYNQSKLAQILFGFELAKRLGARGGVDAGITVNSLHPSTYMPTKIVLDNGIGEVDSLEAGVEATWRVAVDPALDGVTGKFFDRLREGRPNAQAFDEDARETLWARSLELTGAPDLD